MNNLLIPPAPQWYKPQAVTCAPDGTLVYGSKNDIIVITESSLEEPADVRIIHGAHQKNIISVSLKKKWEVTNRYAVSSSEDNTLKLWNLETLEKKTTNSDHTEHKTPLVGAVFAGDDRVVSASTTGLVIVWNINTNDSKALKDLFNSKVTLTCLSSCPHAGWLLAFGLHDGCVVIADLRRNGKVLYRLRGHHEAVLSLAWCPAPVNVFPRYKQNTVTNKSNTQEIEHKDKTPDESKLQKEGQNNELKPCVSLEDTVDDQPNKCNTHEVENKNELFDESKLQEGSISLVDDLNSVVNNDFLDVIGSFLEECDNLKSKIVQMVETADNNGVVALQTELKSEQLETQEKAGVGERDNEENVEKLDAPGDLDDSKNVVEADILEDKDVGNEKGHVKDVDDNPALDESTEDVVKDENSPNKAPEDVEAVVEETESTEDVVKDENSPNKAPEDVEAVVEVTLAPESLEEQPRIEYLLASSGKDQSLYIWRAGTDGRMQTFFNFSKRNRRRNYKSSNPWSGLCWIAPNTILTSSSLGEVLAWSLPKSKEGIKQYELIHQEHSSVIFNIVSPPNFVSEYEWCDKKDLKMWTWSLDGRLIQYDMDSKNVRMCYPTVTSSITCFDSSPLDPNQLAISQRDGVIRVWDLSLQQPKIVTMSKYQHKCTHKVTVLAWHPLKEMILGFGTEEGSVGFLDIAAKKTQLFPHYFRTQVYKVEWGPLSGDTNNLGLYAVAEGKLLIYNMHKSSEDPKQLQFSEKLHVYRFAWKPDFSVLLLSGKDGSLLILNNDLLPVTTVHLGEKGLNALVWHPDAFTGKTEISLRCNWFAASTNKGLLVCSCESLTEQDNFMDNIVASLEGHLRPTTSLVWSPFDGNKILSTASDGLAHVWDVCSKCVLSTFVNPYFDYNSAVIWNPNDPDLIIMGDRVLRMWSVSGNPPKLDEEFVSNRKKLLSKTTKTAKSKGEDAAKIQIKVDVGQNKSKNVIIPPIYSCSDANISLQIENMKKLMCEPTESFQALDPLKIFQSKERVTELLTERYNVSRKEGKHKSCDLTALWKGNIGDAVKDAINENRVTSYHIALAPMVSSKLWQNACEVYAKGLSEDPDSDPLDAATYFLACHNVEEAINHLCLRSMFKDALALAKHRLPDDSDIITEITEKWADQCIKTGNFETAALCYISVKQYDNAAKMLARRNNKQFLDFAAELAEQVGNKGLYDSIKFKLGEIQETAELGNDNNLSKIEAILQKFVDCKGDNSQDFQLQNSIDVDKGEVNGLPLPLIDVREIEASLDLTVSGVGISN